MIVRAKTDSFAWVALIDEATQQAKIEHQGRHVRTMMLILSYISRKTDQMNYELSNPVVPEHPDF